MTAFAWPRWRAGAAAALFVALASPAAASVTLPPLPALPAAAGPIVRDPHAAVALRGFDPVGYFLAGRPVAGSPDHEFSWGGAVWRFASEANRSLFASAPEAYAPVLGGHDPVAAAQARLVEGDPGHFAIIAGRLVIFRSATGRAAADAALLARAETAWPELQTQLAR